MQKYYLSLISVFNGESFSAKTSLAIVVFALCLVVGYFLERYILVNIQNLVAKSKFRLDKVFIKSLKGSTLFWFILLGIFLSLFLLPLPLKYVLLMQKIIKIIWIISLTHFVVKLMLGFINMIVAQSKGADYKSASILRIVISTTIYIVGGLIVLQTLGISIAPILTTLGVGGIGVALALQDTLTNLFSGIHIIASKQIKTGDYIKLESGEEGYVEDISWRNMSIRELGNNIIIIPNGKVAKSILKNYDLPKKEMSVVMQIGVSYKSDLAKVERVTTQVAQEILNEVQGGVEEFDAFIRFHTFNDFSIDFAVILRAREFVDQFLLKHEFVKRLKEKYDEEGIEIPYPIRTVEMKN
jgi:small-conductance mechanosensitive channel